MDNQINNLNSEEIVVYNLGYDDCQFGVSKHENPWAENIGIIDKACRLYEAYKRGYKDCEEANFGSRNA